MAATDQDSVWYIDRRTGERCRETILGERWLRWAYQDARAGFRRGLLFRSRLPSRLLGWYFDSRLSRRRIARTIRELGIDSAEFRDPVTDFASFNAFFTRHLKEGARPAAAGDAVFVSPADGRVLVCPEVYAGRVVPVKGAAWTVAELLGRAAPEYDGGTVIIVRLCPADYHRFHYPCAGDITERRNIAGALHSVNPLALALGINVFNGNRRRVSVMATGQFGRVAFVEVGAFGVGSIVWTHAGEHAEKMEEKGYFKFGGSTIVMVLEPGRLCPDEDLRRHSAAGWETRVRAGERLGTAARTHGDGMPV